MARNDHPQDASTPAGCAGSSASGRLASSRLKAGLARYAGGDIGMAGELAQNAVVAALEQRPQAGCRPIRAHG
jgi:predicted RNA polymerase sigma factor